MSEPSRPLVTVSYQIDPEEMARRGRLGAVAMLARNDPRETTRAGRAVFLSRFNSDEERREYFAELGRKSAEARRERALAATGGDA